MWDNMELTLKNIGKVRTASIALDGITVIAGENNTGKSTVGRALFSIFNSFSNLDKKIRAQRLESISNVFDLVYRNAADDPVFRRNDVREASEEILGHVETFQSDIEKIQERLIQYAFAKEENFQEGTQRMAVEEYALRMQELLNIPEEEIVKSILEKKISAEFRSQVNNIFTEETGEIRLQVKGKHVAVELKENHVSQAKGNITLSTEAIYLDDPFVLDEPQRMYSRYHPSSMPHRMHLRSKLFHSEQEPNVLEEIVVNQKVACILEKIAVACDGEVIQNRRREAAYRRKNSEKTLDMKNLSAGLKTFVILKELLTNGTLAYNGTVILDEPEIHLHPAWQLLFAEIIVLIQKEFQMHILLNTHSPYFLRAIQVYSAKHGIADRCRYYLSELADGQADISDVTGTIDRIYRKLSRPLQELEDMRWQDG